MIQPVFARDLLELRGILLDAGRPEVVKLLDELPPEALKAITGAAFELFRQHTRGVGHPTISFMQHLRIQQGLSCEQLAKAANKAFALVFWQAEKDREARFTASAMAKKTPAARAIQGHLGIPGFQRRNKPKALTPHDVGKIEVDRTHREKANQDHLQALECYFGQSWELLMLPPQEDATEIPEAKRATSGKR